VDNKKLKYTQTNFCSSLGETETNKQIDAAFSVWQSVRGVKFKRVEQRKELRLFMKTTERLGQHS